MFDGPEADIVPFGDLHKVLRKTVHMSASSIFKAHLNASKEEEQNLVSKPECVKKIYNYLELLLDGLSELTDFGVNAV